MSSRTLPRALGFLAGLFVITPLCADCTGVSPVPEAALSTVTVASGLTGRPLYVTSPPGDRDRLFIVEQDGFIRIKKRGEPVGVTHLFLDLSAIVNADPLLNEVGLLGLVFDPGYASNGLFYVNYNEGPPGPWFTVVARYSVSANPDMADPGSETRLLRFQQPDGNHKGGHLMFGPDGYLYIATGDGGGGGDPWGACGNGQNQGTLLGKMLRVDVRGVAPMPLAPDCGGAEAIYAVPADNPFADGPGGTCDEIWDYGLRNPWRNSFDALTGDLYVADVGQSCWEEINYVAAPGGGRNYGWRVMEGNHCFDPAAPSNCDPNGLTCGSSPLCNDPGLTSPAVEIYHGEACSATGGYVYRGCQLPAVAGTYFYGDFCYGWVRSFKMVGGAATEAMDRTDELGLGTTLQFGLTSFGVDDDGEIYIVDRDGSVLRIVPPFTNLEVSGEGAGSQLVLGPGAWSWENLARTTMQPVSTYRVYRGTPGGTFMCVFTGSFPQWPGGDPSIPPVGQMHAYIVTAVNSSGQMTRSGRPPHTLSVAACP
ncbi:MAG: PQQ-dependent sugar dehydrogenase [Candidatus Polarisedimenticolia bacterium]